MTQRAREEMTRRENAALERILRQVIPAAGGAPAGTGDTARILNLACGPCRESSALVRVMRDLRGPGGIRFVGADIRAREVAEAAERARALAAPDAQFEFLATDCATIDRHRELGEGFDLTFLRHQNYWNDPRTWRRIFEAGMSRLHDDGLLVITSYFDHEHTLAVRAIEQAGGQLITSVANPLSEPLDTPGKSVDRHVAVFRRK